MAMDHLFAPAREGRRDASEVHLSAPGGQELLCGHGEVYRTIDGERFQVWYPTKRPVTCRACSKRLELLCRLQLAELSGAQLEDLLNHITTLRNGHSGKG